MAVQVEIEGIAPNSLIDVGERKIVARTQLIRNIVRGGFAKIVRFVPPAAQEKEVRAPEKGARKAEWQEFLNSQGVKFNPEDTKARLMERWERVGTPDTEEPAEEPQQGEDAAAEKDTDASS